MLCNGRGCWMSWISWRRLGDGGGSGKERGNNNGWMRRRRVSSGNIGRTYRVTIWLVWREPMTFLRACNSPRPIDLKIDWSETTVEANLDFLGANELLVFGWAGKSLYVSCCLVPNACQDGYGVRCRARYQQRTKDFWWHDVYQPSIYWGSTILKSKAVRFSRENAIFEVRPSPDILALNSACLAIEAAFNLKQTLRLLRVPWQQSTTECQWHGRPVRNKFQSSFIHDLDSKDSCRHCCNWLVTYTEKDD